MNVFDWLLSQRDRINASEILSILRWEDLFFSSAYNWDEPIDRAIIGGFMSDRTGFAFAAGYESALMKMVPALPQRAIASFCVTEEQGGHPGAITSSLTRPPGGDRWILNGRKKFATLAVEAKVFLVAASTGASPDKKNKIRIARVRRDTQGFEIAPMAELPFIPEISHGALTFRDTPIEDSDILPGDGYAEYIKPFRTIEDLHVSAAIAGYILRVAFLHRWQQSFKERLFSLLAGIRALALEDPRSPGIHIALAGLRQHMSSLLESPSAHWERTDSETRSRWERDKAVLAVGEKSRVRRLEKAWEGY